VSLHAITLPGALQYQELLKNKKESSFFEKKKQKNFCFWCCGG
jgi:hypothetical protein